MIADSGASVSVAAETEMQMGMGFPITGKLLELGVAPSLGVDITSNGSGDMFAQMRLALQVGRMLGDQPYYERMTMPEDVSLTTRQALEWATINGAKGAGLGDVTGTLTPGKQADVVLIDCNHFNLIGWDREDPVGTVVMQANAGNVGTVVVGGKVVKRDGAMVGVDPAEVRRQVEESAGYVRGWADEHGGILPQPRIELGLLMAADGKRVAVLGAGANGAGVGAELRAAGVDVTLIEQWPAHVEKMRADGLRIEMPDRVLESRSRHPPLRGRRDQQALRRRADADEGLRHALGERVDQAAAGRRRPPRRGAERLHRRHDRRRGRARAGDRLRDRVLGADGSPGVVQRDSPPEKSWFAVGASARRRPGASPRSPSCSPTPARPRSSTTSARRSG